MKLKMILALALFALLRSGHADGNVFASTLTFTATANSASGCTVVAAVTGKYIEVVGYEISTDSAAVISIHHQGGAAVFANDTTCNYIGGGYFIAGGGVTRIVGPSILGKAKNQPVTVDVSVACTKIYVTVYYRLQ